MTDNTRAFKKTWESLKSNKFIRFSIIGGIGFLIDLFIFFLAIQIFDSSVYLSRLFSALCAASFTWYGNRLITFSMPKREALWKEWINYIYVMIPGNIMNYLVFFLIVFNIGDNIIILFIAISLGVISGLIINFNLSKIFVFIDKTLP
jgi:putative flippase GtrA